MVETLSLVPGQQNQQHEQSGHAELSVNVLPHRFATHVINREDQSRGVTRPHRARVHGPLLVPISGKSQNVAGLNIRMRLPHGVNDIHLLPVHTSPPRLGATRIPIVADNNRRGC
jgi:hypothetical protein